MKNVKEGIVLLEKKYKSSKGFMGVNFENIKNVEGLLENVKDEIFSISQVVEYGDIEEEFEMSTREAKGYIKKLNNFIVKYGQ